MEGEGLLYTYTVSYAANGKGLGNAAAVFSDDSSFEDLCTGAFTLDDAAINLYVITDVKLGNVCLELLVCKSLNKIHCWLLLIFRVFVQSVAVDHP